MTEVMSAPAEAVVSEVVPVEPNPISVDNVDHEAENLAAQERAKPPVKTEDADKATEKPKPISAREALEKATKTVDLKETPRTETGQFKGKEGEKAPEPVAKPADAATQPVPVAEQAAQPVKAPTPHDEPPARFSPDAKAAWTTAPDPVKTEVHRAVRELESGIEEHRKQWDPVKPYAEMAKQHGTTIDAALERYVAFDKLLNENPMRGIESILEDKGLPPLREIAAHILGQKPDQAASQQDQVVRELRQEIANLKQQVGQVSGHLTKQTESSIEGQITEFAKDKPHFERLAPQIADHIKQGQTLEQAYQTAFDNAQELAKSLGFIPQSATPAPAAPSAQTDKGTKSITGAPGAGSAPATDKPSSSVRDAVRKAMASAQ